MATKVIMPKQGLQMTEGTIIKWIIPEGGKVEAEQPLFEMETDKLNIEMVAPASGTLLKIVKQEGDVVPITETIAIIGEPGEDYTALLLESLNDDVSATKECSDIPVNKEVPITEDTRTKESFGRIFATPRAKTSAEEKQIDYTKVVGTGPEGLIIEKDVLSFDLNAVQTRVRATPVATKMALAEGINLSTISGTGISGRIMKEDIKVTPVSTSNRRGSIVPVSGMRKIISERMMGSIHGMAQANHTMKVDMTEAIEIREQLKEVGIKVSYNDILTKVVAKALIEYPYMNSSLVDEGILLKDYVNMGLAVSIENGLIVPNIKNADVLSLQEIAAVSSDLISKASNGSLSPDDYINGTFTITNLGMYDIDEFTAIVNPPEVGILAVGKIEKNPIVKGETIVIRPILTLKLSYDHRLVDGALAAQFLQRIKTLLRKPYLLL